MATVGAVWINVLPSMQGFASNLQKQATSAAKVAAVGAGTSMGNAMGDATVGALAKKMTANSKRMQATFTGSTNVMTRSLANFRAGFADVDAAASRFTGRMGSLGGATARGLRPGVQAIGGFASGFSDAHAAASAFSGVAGTLGGVARRGLNPAVVAAQNLHAGFTDSAAAASAFTGFMGSLGGVARTALQPGITAVHTIGTGLSTAGATAVSAFSTMRSGVASAFAGVGSAVSSVSDAGATAASQITGFFTNAATTAADSIRNVLGGAIGQVAGLLGVIGLGSLGSQVASVASGAATTQAQIEALYGAAGGGAAEVTALMDGMAERFRGLDMNVMRQGAVSLAYMGLQGEEAVGVLERLEKATTATGSGAVGMERAMSALTKGVNAGKFQMVELNQISDAGIPIYDALSDVLGVDIPTAQKMATDGAIGLEEVLQALSGDHGTWFPALLEGADNVSATFAGAWSTIQSTIVNGFASELMPLFDRATPLMLDLAEKVDQGFQALPGIIDRVRQAFSELMERTGLDKLPGILTGSVIPAARDLWTTVQPLAVIVGGALVVGVRAFMEGLQRLGPVLTSVTGWLAENRKWVTLVGVAILGGVAAYYALGVASAVIRTITSVTKIWTIAQAAFNAVMAMNPIMLVVIAIGALVAGIIYAYKNFEGFRKVVDTVWQAIKTAAMWIWDKGLKPAFDGIMVGIRWVGDAALWLWNSAIKPAWDAIVGAFQATKSGAGNALGWLSDALTAVGETVMGIWTDYVRPAFAFIWRWIKNIVTGIIVVALIPLILWFKAVSTIVTWVWSSVIKPVFAWIGQAAVWLWENALKPAWNWIVDGLKTVGGWFVWLWDNAIKPAIDWIAAGALWLWDNAIKPAWDWIVGGIKRLGGWFTRLWTTYIKPAIDWIADGFTWLWNQIKYAFNWIVAHITRWWTLTKFRFNLAIAFIRGALAGAFNWFKDRVIKPVWNWISGHITRIWENGIKPAFEKVMEGVDWLKDAFNTGKEAIKDAWNGIRDSAKKPINFLIDTVYNEGIRPLWNKVAGVVGADKLDKVKAFATGGAVYGAGTATSDSIPALLSNNEHVWTAREVSAAGGHGAVEAIRQTALAGGFTYARGGRVGFPNPPRIPSARTLLEAVKGFLSPSGLFSLGGDIITGDYESAVDKVLKPARTITKEIGTEGFPGTPYQLVKTGGDKMKAKIRELVEAWNSSMAGGGGADDWVGLGSASERLQRAATWARTQHGKPYQWGGNGNPSWDCSGFVSAIESVIRGQRPHRRWSTHAFQGNRAPAGWVRNLASPYMIGVSHSGVGHTAGTLMGVNVESAGGGKGVLVGSRARGARSSMFPYRYGFAPVAGDRTPIAAPDGPAQLYDRGGYVQPGMTLVANRSGKPEPVLTSAQWRDMHALAQSVGAEGGGQLMRDAHIHLENSEATVEQAFRRLDTELRKRRRGGVHAGRVGG